MANYFCLIFSLSPDIRDGQSPIVLFISRMWEIRKFARFENLRLIFSKRGEMEGFWCVFGEEKERGKNHKDLPSSTSNHNPWPGRLGTASVVSYLSSTSNHNLHVAGHRPCWVVSYLSSTSNHNLPFFFRSRNSVVSYLSSTSNHNRWSSRSFLASVVSYLSSTSNHNMLQTKVSPASVVSYLSSTSNHNNASDS